MRIPELVDSEYHGTGGYLSVEHFRSHSPIVHSFLEATKEFGYDEVDINGQNQTGFTRSQGTFYTTICGGMKHLLYISDTHIGF